VHSFDGARADTTLLWRRRNPCRTSAVGNLEIGGKPRRPIGAVAPHLHLGHLETGGNLFIRASVAIVASAAARSPIHTCIPTTLGPTRGHVARTSLVLFAQCDDPFQCLSRRRDVAGPLLLCGNGESPRSCYSRCRSTRQPFRLVKVSEHGLRGRRRRCRRRPRDLAGFPCDDERPFPGSSSPLHVAAALCSTAARQIVIIFNAKVIACELSLPANSAQAESAHLGSDGRRRHRGPWLDSRRCVCRPATGGDGHGLLRLPSPPRQTLPGAGGIAGLSLKFGHVRAGPGAVVSVVDLRDGLPAETTYSSGTAPGRWRVAPSVL